MKKLIVLLLVLSPICGFAQTGRVLINRVGDQATGKLQTYTTYTLNLSTEEHKFLPLVTPQSATSFSVEMVTGSTISFPAGSLGVIMGNIKNLTLAPLRIKFIRTHVRILPKWTSSICFGINCYSPKTDSLDDDSAYEIQPGMEPGEFRLNIESPSKVTDSLIDFIQFIAVGTNDTMSFVLSGVSAVSGVNDLQPKQLGSNPKITSIYPTPLVQGNAIKVKVTSPRESSISYSIFDNVGREVGLGATRQHIGLGDNTIEIGSLDGLANGSYMLKLKFSDGSNDTHFFQVLK